MIHTTKMLLPSTTPLRVRHGPKLYGGISISTIHLEAIVTNIKHSIGRFFLKDYNDNLALINVKIIQFLTGSIYSTDIIYLVFTIHRSL